ncbi:hypothetical protein ASD78_01035 [Lysobacter sp. Root667]|uniref:hypothetical protein n=1 Tax=Lysobacter sp. Root667 TaxID=1736581 RepID=UPI000700DC99|nr:hypothetical protein [Lysobacter sp. Root667]KRA81889.1 hypothetical protein ASD78_01035 [Lysobacter sp. Root667]
MEHSTSEGLLEYPTTEELRRRLLHHLRRRSATPEMRQLWRGYLAAPVEWNLIDRAAYLALGRLIKDVDDADLYQLFAGEVTPGLRIVGVTDAAP